MPSGVFSTLPENFFSPLATPNKQHYAALLVLYYRLFQESTHGLERELVVREFMNYLTLHRGSVEAESDDDAETHTVVESAAKDQEFSFNDEQTTTGEKTLTEIKDERSLASRFLRRLIRAGWLGEETLSDFSRVINITAYGKPFLEALARIDEGLKTEYESHVVNVYSSLCGETVKENGHFMVLKAREEARALIDSLKVLSQSIKGYYEKLNAEAVRSKAASVLHEHYNLYAGEVLDKAYKRLKTSDNVSRYRQSIFRQIAELLRNDEWLEASAAKYMRIRSDGTHRVSREECKEKLKYMLEEIRDDLKAVDPLEDEIDRRNADYSRASTERIKAYIEPDSTVAGKLGMIIKELYRGNDDLRRRFAHGLYKIQFLSSSSLSLRRPRDEGDFNVPAAKEDQEGVNMAEANLIGRINKQLSVKRIVTWLDEQGGTQKILSPTDLISDEESYIRFIYSLLYGDSRNGFGYSIEEDDEVKTAPVKTADYLVPDIKLRKRDPALENS